MNVDAVVSRYARVGRVAAGFARGKTTNDPVYRTVLPLLQGAGSLLDAGCGEGYLLALAHESDPTLAMFGIDHDERRLAQARVALADVEVTLSVGDLRQADLPAVDVVTCLDVLHYLPTADQDALLVRLAQAVQPGGLLLVRDAVLGSGLRTTITSLTERLALALGRHRGDGLFLRTREALRDATRATGLSVMVEDCADGTWFSNVLFVGRRS